MPHVPHLQTPRAAPAGAANPPMTGSLPCAAYSHMYSLCPQPMASTSALTWKASEAMGLPASAAEAGQHAGLTACCGSDEGRHRQARQQQPAAGTRRSRPLAVACGPAARCSPNVCRAMHCPVSASHSRTSWSSDPEASRFGLRGWKRTTQGVRRCPDSTRTSLPLEQELSLTVWSPLQQVGKGGGEPLDQYKAGAGRTGSAWSTPTCSSIASPRGCTATLPSSKQQQRAMRGWGRVCSRRSYQPTHCVDASSVPSQLYESAMVERGGGWKEA